MRLIIEARLEDARIGAAPAATTIVEVVERQDGSLANLGLTLAEGRALLAKVQSVLVSQQTAGWMASQVACQDCGSELAHKDSRFIVMRTVFGKVKVSSPRLWACSCAGKQQGPRRSLSPLCKALPQRVTPELQYLQAKWAARSPWVVPDAESSLSATHSTHRSSATSPPTQSTSTEIEFANRPASVV